MLSIARSTAPLRDRAAIALTLVLDLLVFPGTTQAVRCYQCGREAWHAILDVMTIPIFMSASTSGTTTTVTITVESVPSSGGTVMVGCDHSAALIPPGGTWPYSLYFPGGTSTTGTVMLAAQNVTSSTVVKVYTFPASALNPADPSCWTQSVSVTVAAAVYLSGTNERASGAILGGSRRSAHGTDRRGDRRGAASYGVPGYSGAGG